MKYHHRLLEPKLLACVESFPCTLVSGARQVGKSTLVAERFGDRFRTFVFDPVQDLFGVREDPDLFLRNNPPPLILDEIQYAPELVPALKRYVDRERRPGMFLITGSQQWQVMRDLAESLAGRVALLELPAFCFQEFEDQEGPCWLNEWFDAEPDDPEDALQRLQTRAVQRYSATERIWRGGFPDVQRLADGVIPGWMQGYVATYLQRDVRTMLSVRDEAQFAAFLSLCAALTAQECNYNQLGRDIGLSAPAAKRWVGVLRSSYQWLEVPAFSMNTVKRVSNRPKGYLADTGLASFLLRLSSPAAVQGHPAFGALFETLVVTECYKQLQQQPLVPALSHYRQHSGAEVDLIIERDGAFFPIEVKAASHVGPRDARSIGIFQETVGTAARTGLIIYGGADVLRVHDRCLAVPFDLL